MMPYLWGIYREQQHSPGREFDDAEILRLVAKHVEAAGYQVHLKTPEQLGAADPCLKPAGTGGSSTGPRPGPSCPTRGRAANRIWKSSAMRKLPGTREPEGRNRRWS